MRVLGIDCGGEYTGYGVVEMISGGRLVCLTCGAIKLSPRDSLARRLALIYDGLGALIGAHRPDEVAIEGIFYALNVKSALKLGQVRGVAMLAAATATAERLAVCSPPASASFKQVRTGVLLERPGGLPLYPKPAPPAAECGWKTC